MQSAIAVTGLPILIYIFSADEDILSLMSPPLPQVIKNDQGVDTLPCRESSYKNCWYSGNRLVQLTKILLSVS